jgi:hypothetical protein
MATETRKAEVVSFPKKCKHGKPMNLICRFSGSYRWEPNCSECDEEQQALEDAELDRWSSFFKERKK